MTKRESGNNDPSKFMMASTFIHPVIVAGQAVRVTDSEGKQYLDLEAGPGVVSVGHCHPHVVEAIRAQAGRLLQSPGRFFSQLAMTLARRISALTGDRLSQVFFANSGAEANDGAIKIALRHALASGKRGFGIVALEHGFHGRLSLPLSLTGMAGRKKGFGPYAAFPGVVHAPAPYCYRCPFGKNHGDCALQCATQFEDLLKTRVPGEAAVLIAEPILGVGGVIVPPDDYWPRMQEICDRHNILLVHDEVFTGYGRTGKMFAHQHWKVKPDIVTFAKALGGGVPMAGIMMTSAVGDAITFGDHFTTFGANNQIGLAAAHAVLDVIEDEKLADNAAVMGERFLAGLRKLQDKHAAIGDVRGRGLMIGVELVKDRTTRAPAPELAKKVQKHLQENGVLVSLTGVHACVVRITPPLVVTAQDVDDALGKIDRALKASAP